MRKSIHDEIVWGVPPSDNISLDDCEWYHIMEVPGVDGLTAGVFDVRSDISNIFGNLDFKDKKVLNLGPSTGYLSFEAERRGADVTSIDLSVDSEERDWVLQQNVDWRKNLTSFMADEKRRRNAFWFAHKALKSKSKLIISNIKNLPTKVETHDIGVIFSVLLHLRDPYLALMRMCSHVNEKIVITELGGYSVKPSLKNFIPNSIRKILGIKRSPLMIFLPKFGKIASVWWKFSPEMIMKMLEMLGFGKFTVNYHYYLDNEKKKVFNFTVVGTRTTPLDECDYNFED
jgi:SAM-dependent methyltransferase